MAPPPHKAGRCGFIIDSKIRAHLHPRLARNAGRKSQGLREVGPVPPQMISLGRCSGAVAATASMSISFVILTHAVGHRVNHLAAHVDGRSVGVQACPPNSDSKPHEGVARIEQGEETPAWFIWLPLLGCTLAKIAVPTNCLARSKIAKVFATSGRHSRRPHS